MAHLRQELRLRDVGAFGAPPRLVRYRFGLFELADQCVLLGAGDQRGQSGRIEAVGEQREIALRRDRHDAEDVIVQVALQREVQRHRKRDRHGCGKHRNRQARRQHARHCDHQQHHEQHEGVGAFVLTDRVHEVVHPGEAIEQVEHDEAQPPASQIAGVGRLRQELPAFGDDDRMDDQHGGGPGAGHDRAGPDARQEADGADQQQDRPAKRTGGSRRTGAAIRSRRPDACAGGRGQPLARLADARGREPAPFGERLFARHRDVAFFGAAHGTPPTRKIGLNSRIILKGALKHAANPMVNNR